MDTSGGWKLQYRVDRNTNLTSMLTPPAQVGTRSAKRGVAKYYVFNYHQLAQVLRPLRPMNRPLAPILLSLPAALLLASSCANTSSPPGDATPTPEDRMTLRVECDQRSLDQCEQDGQCLVRSAGQVVADRSCLETVPIACMWRVECGDQSIVQIMNLEGDIFVSFQDCHPLGWTVLRDEASIEYPNAFQWPECELAPEFPCEIPEDCEALSSKRAAIEAEWTALLEEQRYGELPGPGRCSATLALRELDGCGLDPCWDICRLHRDPQTSLESCVESCEQLKVDLGVDLRDILAAAAFTPGVFTCDICSADTFSFCADMWGCMGAHVGAF